MFYITFHKKEPNIWAYDHDGKLKTKRLLATPACAPPLAELRGMTFGPHGFLYVANGYKNFNQVLVYNGGGDGDGAYNFIGIYADPSVSQALAHPFSVAFDSGDNGYVSSQDTNVVTALSPPSDGQPCDSNPAPDPYVKAAANAVASYLQSLQLGTFLPGTFAASCDGALNRVSPAPPDVPLPQSLNVEPSGGPAKHSVRDVLIAGAVVYIADEAANSVKLYALSTGELLNQITDQDLKNPVHLLLAAGTLYISSSDRIFAYNLESSGLSTFLSGLISPSGMAFDSAGNFFFADRTQNTIYQSVYDANTKKYAPPTVFIPANDGTQASEGLKDNPEFLLYVKS